MCRVLGQRCSLERTPHPHTDRELRLLIGDGAVEARGERPALRGQPPERRVPLVPSRGHLLKHVRPHLRMERQGRREGTLYTCYHWAIYVCGWPPAKSRDFAHGLDAGGSGSSQP